ncbi:hypothetical protein ACW73L_16645 [Methylolobus aquaticus]|nr:hypothetical protein EWI61_02630 [Methylolobus aquaticus]
MKFNLRTTIAALMAGSALASGAANAISVTDLGSVPAAKNGSIALTGTAPVYAWDGQNGITPDCGWAHNSKWYTFTVPWNATVQITMGTGSDTMHPAFSVWQTNGSFVGSNHLSHDYNQISLEGTSSFLKPQTPGGDGATAFVGYANSGIPFTNCDGQAVKKGTPTLSLVEPGSTAAFSKTLKPGQYLIVLGGSCNAADCGTGGPGPHGFNYSLDIRKAPILPLPVAP